MPNQVELGVPVAITQCQHGLILGWEIIWTQSDVDMTIEIATKYRTEFENLGSMSFDRGFWSPQNFEALSALDIEVILPKKGYKNKIERERESAEEFRRKRRQHAQIESCINFSMVVHAFVPKEVRRGLREASVQVWSPRICAESGRC